MTEIRRERALRRTPWAVAAFLRPLVVLLVIALGSSGALPFWAQLAGVEGPHVCRCSIDRHDCVCSKCHPDDEQTLVTSESLQGRCGDDAVLFGSKLLRSVLPANSTLVVLVERARIERASAPRFDGLARPPPTPPPRPSSTAV